MRLAALLALPLVLFGCSNSDEERDASPSEADPYHSLLADEVLKNTPEFVSFEPGTKFEWCYFVVPETDALPQLTESVIAKLRGKYTVCLSESEIPGKSKVVQDGNTIGYKDGFRFTVRAEVLDEQTVKIHYADWVGTLGSSGHFKIYKWLGDSWQHAETGPMVMS